MKPLSMIALACAAFAVAAGCQPNPAPAPTSPAPQAAYYDILGPSVPSPGRKPYTGGQTVISALIDAGFGHEHPGWPAEVSLTRAPRAGASTTTPRDQARIDVRKMLKTGDLSQNYLLEDRDVLTVTPAP